MAGDRARGAGVTAWRAGAQGVLRGSEIAGDASLIPRMGSRLEILRGNGEMIIPEYSGGVKTREWG